MKRSPWFCRLRPMPVQARGRTKACAHQHGGRMDRARAQDRFAATKFPGFAVDQHHDPGDALSFEDESGDRRGRQDGQVLARTYGRIEIAHRGRGAALDRIAHRQRAAAVAEIAVHVGEVRHLPFERVLVHGARQRRPLRRRRAPDRHRPLVAVHVVAEIEVALQRLEIGQHVAPAPAGRAQLDPFGIIVGRAAQRDHAHDRGAAAHDARLVVGGRRRVFARAPMAFQRGPHVGLVVVGRRKCIEHVGRLFSGRRVAAGLDQQHGAPRLRREPVGKDAAGRAAADDDGVEGGCAHSMLRLAVIGARARESFVPPSASRRRG